MAINGPLLQGNWNELRGKVKEKWGQLTDDELRVESGDFDQLIGRIQKKTGEARADIEQFFGELTSSGSAAVARVAQTVGDYAEHANERVREEYDRAARLVRDRPGSAVGTAFGVGVVVGVVLFLAWRPR
jgi:uncharacterized protein YjbJ (UPF0337 family)